MLKSFSVSNFRGFAQKITWRLDAPGNYEFNSFAIKNGIVKNGIIYGNNGSGKSNLGLALFDIVNHLTHNLKKDDYYKNFAYAGACDQPVLFEYTFLFGQTELLYRYAKVKNGKLIEEQLVVDGKSVFSLKNKNHFDIDETLFPMESSLKDNLKNNANNISVINFLVTSFPLSEDHFLLKLQRFVDGMLWFRSLEEREFIGLENTVTQIERYIIKKKLIDDFATFLNDISRQQFTFVNPSPSPDMLFCKIGDAEILFQDIISTGTRSLELFYLWLKKTSEKATFVFIDEFDAFYHFELSYGVCQQLFKQPFQSFVTTHNTFLLTNDLLRPDCNFYLKDNVIKPLNERTQKELRQANNMEKLFRGKSFES